MAIEFSETTNPHGLELFDSIEQRRLTVRTDRPVSADLIRADEFCFPVDTARRIEAETLVFDRKYTVNVHDADGRANVRLEAGDEYDLEDETQFIGLDGPMKLYCCVSDPGRIDLGITSIRLEFAEPVAIELGARSVHERPAGTITTPDDPRAMLDAVTAMASALKTDTPERSWSTLRGHPPLIERGDEFEVRTTGTPPETDVSIEVPPTYRDVYAAAPLSFYLGAKLIPGETPALLTESGRYELGIERLLEDDFARLLKRFLLLDCVVRTEGVYQVDLYERRRLADDLPWRLDDLYEQSLSTQLDRYLEVPYDVLKPYVPRWPMTAHVPSRPEGVEVLPFVVNELGIVRESRGCRQTVRTSVDASIEGRTAGSRPLVRSSGVGCRSAPRSSEDGEAVTVVEPDVTDESIEHAWFGDDIPLGASKATIEGYRSQLDSGSRSQSIHILVVCNDARMLDEHDVLDETYGTRELLPFEITSEFGVSTVELADLLTDGEFDFLHYIGHATEDGLRCTDGDLDVRSLDSVDLGVFFLNACHSYEQGLALVRRGAFGGVATVGDIVNERAVESGAILAGLLNHGLPLRAALEMVGERTVLGDQYLIVGDGSIDIAQTDGGPPTIASVEARHARRLDVSFRHYPTKEYQIGTVTSPNVKSIDEMYLLPIEDVRSTVGANELDDYFTWTTTPALLDDSLRFNADIGRPTFLGEM